MVQQIEEHALQLYRRPHLPKGVPERTLILLRSLFDTVRDAGEGSAPGLQSSGEIAMHSGIVCFPDIKAILRMVNLSISICVVLTVQGGVSPQNRGAAQLLPWPVLQ